MGRYTRLGKNTALVFIGTAGSKLMNLLMLPLYTRWLTVTDYGSTDLINTYAALMLGIISCSIFDAIFIFPKDRPKSIQKRYFSSGICFWLFVMTLTAVASYAGNKIASDLHYTGFISEYLWYIYGILGISYVQNLCQQFLRAIDKMIVYSTTGIVATICTVGFSFLFVSGGGGVKGYVTSIILANLVALIYSIILGKLWRFFGIKDLSRNALIEMLKYSIPLIPNGLMWFLINAFNRPLLESYIGLAAVGIFAVAGRFPNLLNTIYLLFQQAWLISVLEEAKKPTYSEFYNRMLKIVVVGQCFLAVLLAFSAKWIIKIFTTEEFYSAWQYIPLLVVGVIFMNIATFVGSNFAVTRESRHYFYSTVWAGMASLVFNFALIPFLGLWGACWSMTISQAICMIARIKYSWKTVHIINVPFYLYNLIFLSLGIISCTLIESSIKLNLIMCAICTYFYIINARQINSVISLVISSYEKYINRN